MAGRFCCSCETVKEPQVCIMPRAAAILRYWDSWLSGRAIRRPGLWWALLHYTIRLFWDNFLPWNGCCSTLRAACGTRISRVAPWCTWQPGMNVLYLNATVSSRHLFAKHRRCKEHWLLCRVFINDWYNFGDEIRGNHQAHPHITSISRKSNLRNFRIGAISSYYLSLPSGSAILKNGVSREKNIYVIEYAKTNSFTNIHLTHRKRFRKDLPPWTSVQRWFDNFENHRFICKKKSSGCPRVSEEAVWQAETTCNLSPRKTVYKGSHELQTPRTTMWQVLCRRARMTIYKFTYCHVAKPLHWESWSCRRSGLLVLPISLHSDSFLWCYVKGNVFVSTAPLDSD
jgi:hypothetical protein